MNTEYYIGKKYHGITIVKYSHIVGKRKHYECECDCGVIKTICLYDILNDQSKSCGCLRKENMSGLIHGMSDTSTWKSWRSMIRRCYEPSCKGFSYWGGRGIKVCKSWRNFESFLKDMGERPEGKTLDRKNTNKNYSKSNCRWATPQEQGNNRRDNIYLIINGKKITAPNAARKFKVNYSTMLSRIERGWTPERAVGL